MDFRSAQFALLLCIGAFISPNYAWSEDVFCPEGLGSELDVKIGDIIYCDATLSGEVDLYYFLGKQGDQIDLTALRFNLDSFYFELFDPDGVRVTGDLNGIRRTLSKNGIYSIRTMSTIRNFDSNLTYTYILQFSCVQQDCTTELPPDTLGYIPVDPCRIVDTRYGEYGMLSAGETRHFRTYGDISDQNKIAGGAPADYPDQCEFPLGEHGAVHLNVTVVPTDATGTGGFITIWPFATRRPTSSFVNYKAGVQNIANAGTVKARIEDGSTPDISVYSLRRAHVIIDVLGYYVE